MLNIAQIGIGYWGPNLLRNLSTNPQCNIKTVVDLSKERRRFVANNYQNIIITDDIKVVLNDKEIHAIVIATPVSTHFDLAIQSLKAGKHVLIEKPMAKTVKEVNDIARIANDKNLVAMVGHTFLYNVAVHKVKEIIDSGELGDIRYIYSQRVNLGRIRNDVDALWNLAPHDISIIQYWLDEPEPLKIHKQGMDYVQNGLDDVVFMNIHYPNNIMANIHVSWLDPNKIRKITVVGTKKMVVYDDIGKNKITIYDKGIDRKAVLGESMDFDNPLTFQFNHRNGDISIPNMKWIEPLKSEVQHFIDCILTKKSCLTGPEHAAKVVNILESAL